MGKNKGKKGDSSNARLVTTVAMTGGVFLLRKLLATAWTKVTGKVPPTDLTDPKVTLPEVLAWSIATGIVVEIGAVRHRALHDAQVPAGHGSRVKLSAGVSGWPGPPASRLGWSPLTVTCRRGHPPRPAARLSVRRYRRDRPRGRHARGAGFARRRTRGRSAGRSSPRQAGCGGAQGSSASK